MRSIFKAVMSAGGGGNGSVPLFCLACDILRGYSRAPGSPEERAQIEQAAREQGGKLGLSPQLIAGFMGVE